MLYPNLIWLNIHLSVAAKWYKNDRNSWKSITIVLWSAFKASTTKTWSRIFFHLFRISMTYSHLRTILILSVINIVYQYFNRPKSVNRTDDTNHMYSQQRNWISSYCGQNLPNTLLLLRNKSVITSAIMFWTPLLLLLLIAVDKGNKWNNKILFNRIFTITLFLPWRTYCYHGNGFRTL